MTQYVCNPITVDAFQITEIIKCDIERSPDGKRDIIVKLDSGEIYECDPSKTSRMIPTVGDYLVCTHKPDEYEYLNPKHVFEAKYTAIIQTVEPAATPATETPAAPEDEEGAEGEAAGEAA